MRIPRRFIARAQRWAASWWSLGAQAALWVFCAVSLLALLLHRQHYQRGVIPTPLFQGSDAPVFAVMDPASAMREWYILVVYVALYVLTGPALLRASWRLRQRLRSRARDASTPAP